MGSIPVSRGGGIELKLIVMALAQFRNVPIIFLPFASR
jgi:hypothetical protein